VHSYIKRREFSKTKNKSGKQKNVMNQRKNGTREKAMLKFLFKRHHSKKSKLKN